MEKINLKTVLVLLIIGLIASCVPSLHSIVTDETRLFDDRIIGQWVKPKESASLNKVLKNNENDGLSEKTNSPESELFQNGEASFKWRFERAAKIEWEVKSDKDSTQAIRYAYEDVPESMVCPIKGKSVKLISKELLPFYLARYDEPNEDAASQIQIPEIYRYMRMEMTKIGGQVFMDFSPINTEIIGLSYGEPFAYNYIGGHTFAKVEINENNLRIYPFDGEFIENLIKKRRVRLKHEFIRNDQIVLTASTIELREFILKYAQNEDLYDEPYILELL